MNFSLKMRNEAQMLIGSIAKAACEECATSLGAAGLIHKPFEGLGARPREA